MNWFIKYSVKKSGIFLKKLWKVLKLMKRQFSDFCNFQFLRYGRSKFLESSEKKNIYQNMRYVLKRILIQIWQILVFEIWSILCSTTFVVNWGFRYFWEPDSETLTSDTGWPVKPKLSGAWGWSPSNIHFFLNLSKSPMHYECWVQNRPYLKI